MQSAPYYLGMVFFVSVALLGAYFVAVLLLKFFAPAPPPAADVMVVVEKRLRGIELENLGRTWSRTHLEEYETLIQERNRLTHRRSKLQLQAA